MNFSSTRNLASSKSTTLCLVLYFLLVRCGKAASNASTTFQWPPEQPVPIDIFRLSSVESFTPGVQAALERMRLNKTPAAAFDLRVTQVVLSTSPSNKRQDHSALRGMISALTDDTNKTFVFMLGSDSNADNFGLAHIAPVYNLAQLCIFCRSLSGLSDKKYTFPMLLRDSPTDEDYLKVTQALFTALDVESFATLAGDDRVIIDNIRAIEKTLTENGKQVQYSGILTHSTVVEVAAALAKVMPNYILSMPTSPAMSQLICEASRQRLLTPDRTIYIVFGPLVDPEFWTLPDADYDDESSSWNCSGAETAQAVQGSLIIDMAVDVAPDTTIIGNIDVRQLGERLRHIANITARDNMLALPTSTYHMYDLTWSAVDGLYRAAARMSATGSNVSFSAGIAAPYRSPERQQLSKILVEEIAKSRFRGATGDFAYNPDYDRYVDLTIAQLQLDDSNSSNIHVVPVVVGLYRAQLGKVILDERRFKFAAALAGEPPGKWFGTKATAEAHAAMVKLTLILVFVGAAALALAAGAAAYCYKRYRHQANSSNAATYNAEWLVSFKKLINVQLADYDDDVDEEDTQSIAISRASLAKSASSVSNESSTMSARKNTLIATLITFAATGKIPPDRGRARLVESTNNGTGGGAEREVWIRVVQKAALLADATPTIARFGRGKDGRFGSFTQRQKLFLNNLIPQAASLRSLHVHANVVQFAGLCVDYTKDASALVLYEWASKGAIRRYIINTNFELGTDLKNSCMFDIACGLQYLHDKRNALTFGGAHGFLHSNNVVLDNKFTAKLTDYGFWQCRALSDFEPINEMLLGEAVPEKLMMWLKRAPEFLRNGLPVIEEKSAVLLADGAKVLEAKDNMFTKAFVPHKTSSAKRAAIGEIEALQHGDVYSFGMIVVELFTRRLPYLSNHTTPSRALLESLLGYIAASVGSAVSDTNLTSRESWLALNNQQSPVLLGPVAILLGTDISEQLILLMSACTHANAAARPAANDIVRRIQKLPNFSTASVIENLVDKLQSYATDLELVVEKRTKALADEMERSDQLLLQILPRSVAEALKRGHHVPPELFDAVSIYFSDIVGFTELCSASSPTEVVVMLNSLYTMFDSVLENFDVYKVETIGDAYMVASGLPIQNGNKHLSEIAQMSLGLLRAISQFRIAHRPEESMMLRIGLNTGPCAAGVVGVKMPRYCLFGDTVNTASRMESTGEAGKIHVSEKFCAELQSEFPDEFIIEERGEITVKGKGVIKTFWLVAATTA